MVRIAIYHHLPPWPAGKPFRAAISTKEGENPADILFISVFHGRYFVPVRQLKPRAMKTMKAAFLILAAGFMLINTGMGQSNDDALIARKAQRALKSANVLNGITITLGLASNIEMASIGGFPLEVDDGLNAGYNLSHMFFGVGRIATSIYPPIGVAKARRILEPWRDSPEMAASCKKLFANLDAAQVLTAVAPVLTITGGIMMFSASTSYKEVYNYNTGEYTTRMARPGLKTTGWVFVGAGLAASLSSAILIGVTKKELAAKMGSLKISGGAGGVGVKYSLPVKH